MKIEKITIVTPSLPYANLVSRTVMVEYGVPMIATVVRNAGYDVKLYAEHIAPIDWRRVMESDLVCFQLHHAQGHPAHRARTGAASRHAHHHRRGPRVGHG